MVEVRYGESHWHEVKLAAEKQTALSLFATRQPLLMALVEGMVSCETLAGFVATVERRPGRFLLMDPEEVLGGMSNDDSTHAERFVRLLTLLGSEDGSTETVREAARPNGLP
jgi:hypothetical protein